MEKKDLIKYGYYDDLKKYCVILDYNKLKKMYNADYIFLDTEE